MREDKDHELIVPRSTREIADRWNLNEKNLAERRYKGLPPKFLKVGSSVYYRDIDIKEWLDGCVRHSTSEALNGRSG